MTTKHAYRKLYTKISVSPDTLTELDALKKQLTEENPDKKPASYNTALKHLIQNQHL